MNFAYTDLGEQQEGALVEIKVHGGARRGMLLSQADMLRYHANKPFQYKGGPLHGKALQVSVPRKDHWFAVVEFGSYNGKAKANVEVTPPEVAPE